MSGKGINEFMKSQKLFSPQSSRLEPNVRLADTSSKLRRHHYPLGTQSQAHNSSPNDAKEKTKDTIVEIDKQEQDKIVSQYKAARVVQSRNSPTHPALNRSTQRSKPKISVMQDSPTIEEQSPTKWQAIVIKSSRKYFDSCRSEALEYIAKLQDILNKDSQYLQQCLSAMHGKVQQAHAQMADSIKQSLWHIVEEAVQKWRVESVAKYRSKQLSYMGELYQLNTQIDQRYKQVTKFRDELDNDKQWKVRASDLLTSTYEADFIELSKLCKKSIELAEANADKYWQNTSKDLVGRFGDAKVMEGLRDGLYAMICQQCAGDQKQKVAQSVTKSVVGDSNNIRRELFGGSQNANPQTNPTQNSREINKQSSKEVARQMQSSQYNRQSDPPVVRNRKVYEQYIEKVYTFSQEQDPTG